MMDGLVETLAEVRDVQGRLAGAPTLARARMSRAGQETVLGASVSKEDAK